MEETSGGRRVPRPLIVAVVLLAAVASIGVIWYLAFGPGQASPPGSTVAEFTGTGNLTTESFSVRQGWRIDWETTGDRLSFAISGDRDFGTVVDQHEPGSGVTSPTGSGSFHLEINAQGPWSIIVVQGD